MYRHDAYKEESVPEFGHKLLKYWSFDEGYINLNHGSYGSPPTPVLEACTKLEAQIEGNPDKFIRVLYAGMSKGVRARVAQFIGADADEVVIVPNASHGINTVLRNIEWKTGDIIIKTNITYGAILKTIKYISDTVPGIKVTSVDISFPTTHVEIFESFKNHFESLKATRPEGANVFLVLDALTSNPGLLLPWERIAELCHKEGIMSLIDAAHTIGQQVDVNLSISKPDFWVSNCHKWLYTKRGCAVLYVPKRNQHIMKTTFPTSFGYISPTDANADEAPNFVRQFEWTGAHDPAPYLSIDAALDFRQWLGGEAKINNYTRSLAIEGGKRASEILGTQLLDQTENSEFTLNMVNVKLPVPDTADHGVRSKVVAFLTDQTLIQYNCSVPVFHYKSAWWARFSSQVFNELSDFEYVAKTLLSLCQEIVKTEIDEEGNARVAGPTLV